MDHRPQLPTVVRPPWIVVPNCLPSFIRHGSSSPAACRRLSAMDHRPQLPAVVHSPAKDHCFVRLPHRAIRLSSLSKTKAKGPLPSLTRDEGEWDATVCSCYCLSLLTGDREEGWVL
ncbi:hypothetical protein ACLOJK_022099 [Asimina triloba]